MENRRSLTGLLAESRASNVSHCQQKSTRFLGALRRARNSSPVELVMPVVVVVVATAFDRGNCRKQYCH